MSKQENKSVNKENKSVNNKKENIMTVQQQTTTLKDSLLNLGFNSAMLDLMTLQQLQTAFDNVQDKVLPSDESKSKNSNSIQTRFLKYLDEQETNRLSYDSAYNFILTDLCIDKKWFNLTVLKEMNKDNTMSTEQIRQVVYMFATDKYSSEQWSKIKSRVTNVITTKITHESDDNATTNQTVNKILKDSERIERCKLIKNSGVKVAIEIS